MTDGSLCHRFVDALPVTGASISVFDEAGNQSTVCTSDDLATRLEELQFSLGEGPHWAALHTQKPILVPDLAAEVHPQWPMFATAIRGLRVGALFAFPLVMGSVAVGVVDLYRSTPGELDPGDVSLASTLAAGASLPAALLAVRSAGQEHCDVSLGAAPELRREVHQATGMILAQLNVGATAAFGLLRARAFSNGRSINDEASDVVARTVDFRLEAE